MRSNGCLNSETIRHSNPECSTNPRLPISRLVQDLPQTAATGGGVWWPGRCKAARWAKRAPARNPANVTSIRFAFITFTTCTIDIPSSFSSDSLALSLAPIRSGLLHLSYTIDILFKGSLQANHQRISETPYIAIQSIPSFELVVSSPTEGVL